MILAPALVHEAAKAVVQGKLPQAIIDAASALGVDAPPAVVTDENGLTKVYSAPDPRYLDAGTVCVMRSVAKSPRDMKNSDHLTVNQSPDVVVMLAAQSINDPEGLAADMRVYLSALQTIFAAGSATFDAFPGKSLTYRLADSTTTPMSLPMGKSPAKQGVSVLVTFRAIERTDQ